MGTWVAEDRILFPCDFFGSHLATSELFATERARVLEAARLYYAQIMMPYAATIAKNLDKVAALAPDSLLRFTVLRSTRQLELDLNLPPSPLPTSVATPAAAARLRPSISRYPQRTSSNKGWYPRE